MRDYYKMKSIVEKYQQINNIKFINEQYGKMQWVQISGHEMLNDTDAEYWCALVSMDKLPKVFNRCDWDICNMNGGPGFVGCCDKYEYKQNLLDEGFEQLLYYREFYGVKENYVELSQEFILLNNLYFDMQKNIYYAICENGDFEEVVRINNKDTVSVKLSFLLRYATAKQMAVLLFFDIRASICGSLKSYGLTKYSDVRKEKDLYYEIRGDEMHMSSEMEVYSVLMGKKILYPRSVESCGYWPYEKGEKYEDYIIGIDESGNAKTYTCDPDKLANYFGANPDAPHYLTPVFFKREVLQKYLSHPELYEVRDGYLACKSLWGIQIDNHHKDYVAAYLGDLGRDLPESERLYWKSFNVISEEKISKTTFERDFLCIPAKSDMIEHKFKQHYIEINEIWNKAYGWRIFLPLSADDQYNFDVLRIPITDSQEEFDSLVLSLVKVLIDSLNEKRIQEMLEDEDSQKGISKLEKWLKKTDCKGYEIHIQFLRDLQELRSTGTGHRKGNNYEKISTKFSIGYKGLKDVFEEILLKSDDFMRLLYEIATEKMM